MSVRAAVCPPAGEETGAEDGRGLSAPDTLTAVAHALARAVARQLVRVRQVA